MEIPEWIAVMSVAVALISLAGEQHRTRHQSKADARDRHSERTQTLLLKALEDPELLQAIGGASDGDQKQRRYRQLWFNHMEMFFRSRGLFDSAHWKGSVNDFRSFLNMPAMQLHWQEHRQYYAADFQTFIDKEIITTDAGAHKLEPPPPPSHASST